MDTFSPLKEAIEKALANGWRPSELGHGLDIERVEIDNPKLATLYFKDNKFESSVRISEIIFDHAFAKALWGFMLVNRYGLDMDLLRVWAKQVAVKHMDKLYEVDPSKRVHVVYETPPLQVADSINDILPEAKKVQYQLEDMYAQIPFETHRLQDVEVPTAMPAWKHHLQQLVVTDDPIGYIALHLDIKN